MEFGLKEENHNMDDFFNVLEKHWHMIRFVPPLSSITTLNIIRCSWGSVVLLYGSKVSGRQKPSNKGIVMMNSEKGLLEEYRDVENGGIGVCVA